MPVVRSFLTRVLPVLALLLMGAALAAWLCPEESRAVAAQIANFPDSDVRSHSYRPWIVAAMCLLPALAMAWYEIGDRLDRYVLRQFAAILGISFGALFVIWMLVDLSDNLADFRKSGEAMRTALSYYGTRFPSIVLLLLPYSLLLSVIYALGKLSRDREMVAMVQGGRSVVRIALPIAGVGLWCSLLCLGLNYHWAPSAEGRKKEILDRAMGVPVTKADHVLYFNADERRLWMVGFFPDHYEHGEPLRYVDITTTEPRGGVAERLTAATARWQKGSGTWTFDNAVLGHYPPGEPPYFEKPDHPLVREGWPETPWQLIRPGLPASYLGVPDLNAWLAARSQRYGPGDRASAPYLTQWYYRWAAPFACLVTVLLATPLSIHFSRRGAGGGVFMAIVLSVAMLISSNIILSFGEGGIIPPALAAWLPNIIFTLASLWLFRVRVAGRMPLRWLFRPILAKS